MSEVTPQPRRGFRITSPLHAYAVALGALALAIALHLALRQVFPGNFSVIFFVYLSAILIAAWCGYGPGFLIVLISVLGVPFLFRPNFSLSSVDPGRVAVLLAVSWMISRTAASRRRAERLLQEANDRLEQRVQEQMAALQIANTKLRQQLAQLETLYGKLVVGLCFLDRDLRFVRINEELAAVNGLPMEEHSGRTLREVLPPALADVLEPVYRSVLDSGEQVLDFEVRDALPANPATVKTWLVGCSPVRLEDGAIIGLQVVVQDITERKLAEEALRHANAELRQSEELFRTLANAIPQLCWMANADGWIFWYNDRWYEYTGTTPEQMQGWGWADVHHPSTLGDVMERWKASLENGEPFEMVFPLRRVDGVFRPFLTRAHPLKDRAGRVVRWFGSNTDITERKAVENALERTNEALRRANEDLAQFAYIAAHDLQEPLRTVAIFSQIVQRTYEGKLGEDTDFHLASIGQAAKRMSQLIADVLTYSRATADSERSTQPVDMNRVLESAMHSLSLRVSEAQAKVSAGPLPTVEGDARQLEQVLQNLLSNALKYRRSGIRPEIHVDVELNDGMWMFSVADNGVGFRQEYASQVFGIFKRLHGQEVPGSGIGLAICKAVIERHGGRVWAEAEEGRGATFHFTLPAAKAKAAYE